jgi:signal transduction histidine kinase
MTADLKIRCPFGLFFWGGWQWWKFFRGTGLKVFLGAFTVLFLWNRAGANDALGAEGKEEWATYRLAKVPADATNGLGGWIWTNKTFDRQTCRLWKGFDIPSGAKVTSARLKMTVDNGYQFFLDGRELGQGADWRALTEYDLTLLLSPGRHVLAINCFNDFFQAGLIMDLEIRLSDGKTMDIKSDESWRVVPETEEGWERLKYQRAEWPAAIVIRGTNEAPQWADKGWPYDYVSVPRFRPQLIPFWQTAWFHLMLAFAGGLVLLACVLLSVQLAVHRKEQRMLNLERARIARDIHDDFGTRLTRLVLESEVGQSEAGPETVARGRFSRIGEGLREALEAMDEVLWAVNPRHDTVSDFVTYVCEYAQNFLQPSGIQCLLEVEPHMPALEFDLPLRRSLLLAVKEAINNAAKHAGATKLWLKIHRRESTLVVVVEDDGKGFDPAQADGQRHGMGNMIQRMREVGGRCLVVSQPGTGCRMEFTIPLTRRRRKRWESENKSGGP